MLKCCHWFASLRSAGNYPISSSTSILCTFIASIHSFKLYLNVAIYFLAIIIGFATFCLFVTLKHPMILFTHLVFIKVVRRFFTVFGLLVLMLVFVFIVFIAAIFKNWSYTKGFVMKKRDLLNFGLATAAAEIVPTSLVVSFQSYYYLKKNVNLPLEPLLISCYLQKPILSHRLSYFLISHLGLRCAVSDSAGLCSEIYFQHCSPDNPLAGLTSLNVKNKLSTPTEAACSILFFNCQVSIRNHLCFTTVASMMPFIIC